MRIRIPPGYAEAKELELAWAEGVDTLYKFRSFSGPSRRWVRDIVKNSRIYFSTPSQFNDPFDVAPLVRHSGDPNSSRYVAALQREQARIAQRQGLSARSVSALLRQTVTGVHCLPRRVEGELRKELGRSRILSLSADHLHPLQWSHYANSHKGVCLHFWSSYGSPFGAAKKVHYSRVRLPLLIAPKPIPANVGIRLAYIKAKFWSYEHEYRVIRRDGVPPDDLRDGFLQFDPRLLIGITIGMRMPSRDRAILIQLLAKYRPTLPAWEAFADPDKFALQIRSLGPAGALLKPRPGRARRKV
jgi:hypothetical protein